MSRGAKFDGEARELAPGEMVKRIVGGIPKGRAATYGTIGRVAGAIGRPIGGARTVAWILASLKRQDTTPWHRVVGAGGKILLPDRRGALQRSLLKKDGARSLGAALDPAQLVDETALLQMLLRGRSAKKSADR